MPSEHTIVLIALIAAGVLIASVLVVRRDAWLPVARSHKQIVRGAVIGAVVIVLVALGSRTRTTSRSCSTASRAGTRGGSRSRSRSRRSRSAATSC